jgi:hypothetical protein
MSSRLIEALLIPLSIGSSKLVIIGGLAEIFSGMLSMGLGEYLSTNTKEKQWKIEYDREQREVVEKPADEEEEIYEIFDEYRIPRASVQPIVEELKKDPNNWVDVGAAGTQSPSLLTVAVHDGL